MASSRIWRRGVGLLGLAVVAACAQPIESVRDVRFTSQSDVTRVVIALSSEAVFRTERIDNPDRVFFDLPRFVPRLAAGKQRSAQFMVGDRNIRQIRVAENQPGLTRLVFDMESPDVVYKAVFAMDPPRIIVEFRRNQSVPPGTIERQKELMAVAPTPEAKPQEIRKSETKLAVRHFDPATIPVRTSRRQPVILMTTPPEFQVYPRVPARPAIAPYPQFASVTPPARVTKAAIVEDPLPRHLPEAPAPKKAEVTTIAASLPKRNVAPEIIPPPVPDRTAVPDRSMIRALGLKVNRIVIDPGHGGQDYGTSSPSGLHEKELVLDVSKRLATLLRQSLGAEVILTRTDDTFVSLDDRTIMANQRKADLFISVHANSSPARSAFGIETFYLNFAASAGALEVASRENSSARKNVHDLNDLLQKIALNAKLDESRDFAQKVQNALVAGDTTRGRNRGVKRAPFIVLIGADMPAILTEIGFVTNPAEETNLRKSEYRQKIAEQIFNGVAAYASSLNPTQVAQRNSQTAAPATADAR